MTQAVRTWRFKPAEMDIPAARRKPGEPAIERVDAKVLVAGVFRRPSVIGLTLGEPIRDVATASADIPFPTSIATLIYPPAAISPGVVLVEVQVDTSGGVSDARVRVSSPGFDSVALSAARQWTVPAGKNPRDECAGSGLHRVRIPRAEGLIPTSEGPAKPGS